RDIRHVQGVSHVRTPGGRDIWHALIPTRAESPVSRGFLATASRWLSTTDDPDGTRRLQRSAPSALVRDRPQRRSPTLAFRAPPVVECIPRAKALASRAMPACAASSAPPGASAPP